MEKLIKGLLTILAMIVTIVAAAQIPDTHIKPVPMDAKDTLQQVIESRKADFETSTDPKNSSTVYKGIFAFSDLAQVPNFSWLPKGMDDYHPKNRQVKYLKKNIKNYKLLIFLGTWCGDSKDLIPKLFQVLDEANISYDDMMMVGMDRAKTTNTTIATQLVEKYKITRLPTIVVIGQNSEETGRITETVHKSVEKDLADIIKAAQ